MRLACAVESGAVRPACAVESGAVRPACAKSLPAGGTHTGHPPPDGGDAAATPDGGDAAATSAGDTINGGTPSLQRIQNAFDVACGEEVALHRVAEVFVAFASHGRRVVWADETFGGVFQRDPQEFRHVRRTIVVERFAEACLAAGYVAEMEEENPFAEFWNQFENVFAHRTESGLAERDTMRWTVA